MNTNIRRIRTLVVDDSQEECELLSFQLRDVESVQVIGYVHDGLEAISYLRGTEQFKDREVFPYPDLMLLDYSMPHCGGMEVLLFLQRQFYRPRVVLWSNTVDLISIARATQLGADLVCQKPVDKRGLLAIIHRLEARVFMTAPALPAQRSDEIVCLQA